MYYELDQEELADLGLAECDSCGGPIYGAADHRLEYDDDGNVVEWHTYHLGCA